MTVDIAALVSDNLDFWTPAVERKSGAGRGGGQRITLYGIDRLRALILELAVRGKLVLQDPRDEPAADLLERIKSEKARLLKVGKAKPGKPLSVPENWPFDIPDNWVWSQLGYVTNYGQTEKADPGSVSPETWVLELEDVEKSTSRLLERVRCSDRQFQSQKNIFQAGDVVYGKLRPYLDKVIIADEQGVCTTEMVPMRGYGKVCSEYIRLFLKTPYFIALATKAAHGMNLPRLGTEKAREAPFALPPLAEQQRIVAKVDELMALCDALEMESAAAMAAHQTLVETLLATLTARAGTNDLSSNWARFEAHFDTLFITEESVDALKKAVLDLAVRGKLAAQDYGDEPASELIKRIGEQYGKKLGERHAKIELNTEVLDFDLPVGWAEPNLAEIGETFIGLTYSPKDVGSIGVPVLRSSNIKNGKIDLADLVRVRTQINQKLFVESGDLLICVRNGSRALVGKCALIADLDEPMTFGAFMAIYKSPLNEYVKLYIESPTFRRRLLGVETTTINQITQAKLKATPIPLPPLAEQHRIVAKVAELMALCDSLKARITDATAVQRQLADTIVEQAAV